MKAEIKEKWLEALRSGDYEQGEGGLHKGETFCCLGVLCDIAIKEGIGRWAPNVDLENENEIDLYGFNGGECRVLPLQIQDWAGLRLSNPIVRHSNVKGSNPFKKAISVVNDNYGDFDEIADLIEKQL